MDPRMFVRMVCHGPHALPRRGNSIERHGKGRIANPTGLTLIRLHHTDSEYGKASPIKGYPPYLNRQLEACGMSPLLCAARL